eukprot:TRINITY_DN1183_c0_g1_i3.p1 TRINITY_DN1183_c0_g1~~TRINITY_DN1183_c0_g1_i3.p1  ORF type:complete len:439 (+),score=117.85 TRINITY_DN1183_c0_g1_i3:110-1318(+)
MAPAPMCSPAQRAAAERDYPSVPQSCMVTGGTGFVGLRVVEMLVERGAKKVLSFDKVPPPENAWRHPAIEYCIGDLRDAEAVASACKGVDCVWHIGACVGPFHPKRLYHEVNVQGTLNVIAGCRRHGVRKLVMSSSPSTRFDGRDVDGLREDQMPSIQEQIRKDAFLQEYAKTKALGELELTSACDSSLLTVAVAPHQVYGPRDNLFLPNMLETARTGKLRVFGNGRNRICFSHVDNYAHGLILAERALYEGSPALGQFYVVTDAATHRYKEGYCLFWDELDLATTSLGLGSLKAKMHLPLLLMWTLAYAAALVGWVLRRPMKLNPFSVRMLTMHRWFDTSRAERDLRYQPIIGYEEGWNDTIEWFRSNWLPQQKKEGSSYGAIASQTQRKIDIQDSVVNAP